MKVILKIQSVNTDQLRIVAAVCSRNRDEFPHSTQPWQPRVQCEGPYFGLELSPMPLQVAQEILHELEQHEMETQP